MVSAADGFSPQIAMGLFALYVVAVSLVRLLREPEFYRLTAMKKLWGRTRGLAMHFVSNVALPLVLGIVFLSHGLINLEGGRGMVSRYDAIPHDHAFRHIAPADFGVPRLAVDDFREVFLSESRHHPQPAESLLLLRSEPLPQIPWAP